MSHHFYVTHEQMVAEGYRELSVFRRWMVYLLAPTLAKSARGMARNTVPLPRWEYPAQYPAPPQEDTRGPLERWGDRTLR